jgi:hypothetical protein
LVSPEAPRVEVMNQQNCIAKVARSTIHTRIQSAQNQL